jgi:hypothetical protein
MTRPLRVRSVLLRSLEDHFVLEAVGEFTGGGPPGKYEFPPLGTKFVNFSVEAVVREGNDLVFPFLRVYSEQRTCCRRGEQPYEQKKNSNNRLEVGGWTAPSLLFTRCGGNWQYLRSFHLRLSGACLRTGDWSCRWHRYGVAWVQGRLRDVKFRLKSAARALDYLALILRLEFQVQRAVIALALGCHWFVGFGLDFNPTAGGTTSKIRRWRSLER